MSIRSLRGRRSPAFLLPLALFAWALALPAPAAAITTQVDLLLDLDADPSTGCSISTVLGPFDGVEQVLVTTVETSGGSGVVDSVERRECVGTTLGPATPVDPGDWPVGIGLGLDGSDVVETYLPLAGVSGNPRTIRIGVVTIGPSGADALLETAAGGPIILDLRTLLEIPTLSEWGLILFVLLLMAAASHFLGARRTAAFALVVVLVGGGALAYAAGSLDGQTDDWGPGDLLAEGTGSNGPGPDIEGVFGKEDTGSYCFRIDAELPKNDAPDARDDAFSTPEDTQLAGDVLADNGSGADSDPNGDPLAVDPTPVSGPTDGTLDLEADGTFTYDPDPDFNGTDSFVYRLTDGQGGEDTATATITVDPVNDGPSADPVAETTAEDTPVTVTLSGSDPEGDPLTFAIDTGPSDGALGPITSTGPSTAEVTYTPNADFTGTDSFTYTANDGTDTSAPALAEITVTPENDPPVADDRAGSTTEDVATTFVLTGSDVDGDDLTFSIVTGPAKGTLGAVVQTGLTTAEVDYTPDPDTNGADSFTYKANDGTVDSNVATFSITVDPDADAPVADDGAETTLEDTPVTITLSGSDPDGDSLTFSIDTPPANGSLSAITSTGATTATVDYTPDPDFNGADSFTFKANDGTVDSGPATVALDVTPVNDAPSFALPGSPNQSVPEDSPAQTVPGFASSISAGPPDESGQAVSFTVTNDANALFSAQPAIDGAGNLTYTPAPDANGTATVTVTAVDDGGTADGGVDTSAPQSFDITITPVDDPPTAVDDTATVAEDAPATAIDVLANDTDPDGGPKEVTGITQPANGTVANGTTNVTYTPNANYCNDGVTTDDFTYTVTGSDTATVQVTVTCVNDPPSVLGEIFDVGAGNFDPAIGNTTLQFANSDTVTHPHVYVAGDVLDNDSDIDGPAALSISAFDATSANGGDVSMNLATGEFTYSPPTGFEGTDTFQYTVSDGGAGGTAPGTVTIEIADVVWYVDNDPANDGTGDDGRAASPFDSIAQLEAENGGGNPDDPEAGDTIFFFEGTSAYDAGAGDLDGIDLLNGQKLLGEGVDLLVGATTLVTGNPANRPQIDNTNAGGDAVTVLADATEGDKTGVEIRGFRLDAADDAVEVTSADSGAVGVLVADNFFEDAGGEAIDANPGSSAAFDLVVEDNGYATASAGGRGIDLVSTGAGTVTVAIDGNADVTSSSGDGIRIEKAGAGDVFVTSFDGNSVHGNNAGVGIRVIGAVFDADTGSAGFQQVTGGDTAVGTSGNGVGGSAMVLSNVAGDLAFGDLDLFTDGAGGIGLDATGSGVFNNAVPSGFRLVSTGGTVAAASGPAVDLDPFTAGLIFDSVGSTGSAVHGIRLHDLAGTFTANGGTLAGSLGSAIRVTGTTPGDSTVVVTLDGLVIDHPAGVTPVVFGQNSAGSFGLTNATITKGGGRLVEFDDMDGGSSFAGTAVTGTGHHGKRVIDSAGIHDLLPVVITTPPPAGVDALHLANNTGTFNVPALDVVTNASRGLFANNGGTINLTGVSNDVATTGHTAIEMSNTTIGGSGMTFSSITANATGANEGIDLDAVGGGAFQVTGSTTVNTTGAGNAGIDIATSSATFTFGSIDIDATGGAGVALTNNSGAVTINGGAIDGPIGTAFDVNQGGANVTYAGTIGNTVGKSVEITDRTGGTVTLSGNIGHGPANAIGIDVNTNTGGSTVFSGGSKTIDAGTGNAVSLATNGGHTIRFTNGGLDIDTTSGTGFRAIGGGTVEVSGAGNTIDGGAGRALHVDATDIDAAGLTFERIASSGGAVPGIELDSTGIAGGLTVTGAGGDCKSNAAQCSGGAILNKTGNTDGILLDTTVELDLSHMNVSGHSRNGIFGTAVDGFRLNQSRFVGNADAVSPDEAGIYFVDSTGAALGNARETRFDDLRVENSHEHNVIIRNTTGTLTDLAVANSIFTNNGASGEAGSNFFVDSGGTANVTVNATGSQFNGNTTPATLTAFGFVGDAADTSTLSVDVSASTFANNNVALSASAANGSSVTFDFSNNPTVTGSRSNAVNVFANASHSGALSGRIESNVIGTNGSLSSGSQFGVGVRIANEGTGTVTALIDGNTIREIGDGTGNGFEGIFVNENVNGGTTNATITGNTIDQIRDDRGINVQQVLGGGTVCSDISGNVLTNIFSSTPIRVRQVSGTHNNRQLDPAGPASPNRLDTANGGVSVSVAGTINFNSGACPQP